jgi:predicted nucleotidyltransferase
MLIGGWALPLYGVVRTTVDIDLAIATKLLEPMQLRKALENAGFQVSSFSQGTPYFVVTDTKAVVEIEVWLKPNGITIDEECLRRRKKVKVGELDFWVIGPEDLIVNKLARSDRRAQDDADVLGVLENMKAELDFAYLHHIAERADILPLLQVMQRKIRQR